MKLDDLRLAVHPGPGLVARFDRIVLLVAGDSTSQDAADIVDAARSYESAPDRLRALGADKSRAHPAFFALVDVGDTVLSFVSGAMKVSIEMEGSKLEFASTDPQGWTEENLRGTVRVIAVAKQAVKLGSQPLSDLIRGVVIGGGVELVDRGAAVARKPKAAEVAATRPTAAPAKDAVPDTQHMEPPKEALSEAQAGIAGVAEMGELPTMAGNLRAIPEGLVVVVEGRPCPSGHLNDPLAPVCRVCGQTLLEAVSKGPRPPLGQLVGKSGLTIVLDRNYVIGRSPELAPEVASGAYTPVTLPASEGGVSRIHCDIRVAQWSVLLTDRDSANGTFIRPVGVGEWIRLEPGHTVQVVPGSGISIGPYEFRFDP